MTGIGERLIRARETRGLTLEDAERDTRISRRYLQALETEEFEIIPAPVYARGFLRSYSQYVGLDPQEMLSLFPREDGMPPLPPPVSGPPSRENPVSSVSASRPVWHQPLTPAPRELIIGVNIGVVRPPRRINHDPDAQTRTALVAAVAVGAIAAVLALAWLISNLGGDGAGLGPGVPQGTSPDVTATATTASASTGVSGLNVKRGVVPDVTGETADIALLAIAEAGYVADQSTDPSATVPQGFVISQGPAPGTVRDEGSTVIIIVSTGP